eukprot:comp11423_c0_seq1/m.5829 comp11423_c0_seq1/g.5829  ORF comp11423_c0_seq1/g.5829 comp11423_c0_seq1/m.5829 type:complete len:384 (-) comp11423_c0_seq1:487-1638(-)
MMSVGNTKEMCPLTDSMGGTQPSPLSLSPSNLMNALLNLFPGFSFDTSNIIIQIDDDDCTEKGTNLFLHTYSRDEVERIVLDTPKVQEKLGALGFHNLLVQIDTTDNFVHHIYLYDTGLHDIKPPSNNIAPRSLRDHEQEGRRLSIGAYDCLLMELSLRPKDTITGFVAIRGRHADPCTRKIIQSMGALPQLNLLDVEWLLLQDPTREFAPNEQPLPGQKYPGLHLGKEIGEMISRQAMQEGRDAIVNNPLYFHNAVMYAHGGCTFVNPEFEGVFQSLCADLMPYLLDPKLGLAVVSRAIYHGRLVHKATGKRVKWVAQEQLLPFSSRLRNILTNSDYKSVKAKYYQKGTFDIDWEGSPISTEEDWEQAVPIGDVAALMESCK